MFLSHLFLLPNLISLFKRCKIKFNTLFDYENNNRIQLKSIAFHHSADIDYEKFVKIYRECTKEPYNFLMIDTTLPASDPLRFRKNLFKSLLK